MLKKHKQFIRVFAIFLVLVIFANIVIPNISFASSYDDLKALVTEIENDQTLASTVYTNFLYSKDPRPTKEVYGDEYVDAMTKWLAVALIPEKDRSTKIKNAFIESEPYLNENLKAEDIDDTYYLNAYKDAYVQYNRDKIIKYAYAAGIRPELLGGVAWIESGGMPENYKFQIYETKRMIGLLDMPENKTSFGSMGIQIRTAAITLGLDPSELTTRNQLELATCLMEDDFTFQIAATYLRDLVLFDYPSSATLYMTNEQYIMAGIRYNRGVERDLGFFICLINNLPARDTDDYKFISYGMRLLEIREHIKKLINE